MKKLRPTEESTFDKTVRNLADEVDYWKNRAVEAEEKLEYFQLKSCEDSGILDNPSLDSCDKMLAGLLGFKPAKERLAQLKEKHERHF